jgi:hypothetical protein
MRRVAPHLFLLFAGTLEEAHQAGRTQEALAVLRDGQPGASRPDVADVPVALRWVTVPDIGFPRTRFEVWRRPRVEKPSTRLLDGPLVVTGGTAVGGWAAGEMYEVHVDAAPAAGATLTVDALDVHGHAIPGQRIVFTAPARGGFRSPGIAALRAHGSGSLGVPLGSPQNEVANAADWERVQVVGLPLAKTEIAPPVYDPTPQGYEPPSLDGLDAALLRLAISRVLRTPIPPTGVADIPTPAWDAPDPVGFMQRLRGVSPALVPLIAKCLGASDDTDLARLQALFEADALLPGVRQADVPGATPGTDPTRIRLPVAGVAMLSAGSDSDAATGLGYGTVDFAERRPLGDSHVVVPPGTVRTAYDYMVTAPYVFPLFGPVDLAALAQVRPLPEPAQALQAARRQGNRAPGRDQPATESVQLSWRLSTLPQGYGALVSRGPGAAAILNAPRLAGGYDPFIPLRPQSVDREPPAGARTTFTDPVSTVPIAGSATSRYLVAGLDVFGRWSPWRLILYTSSAPPVQIPGLFAATLWTDVAARSGRLVPATLEVEIAWDWSDRSPDRIELTAAFTSPTAPPPATPAAGVPFGPTGPVVVRFAAGGAPFIASGHAGTVAAVPTHPPDPDRRRYRLALTGVTCDYTTAGEVALAVWARGVEAVRPAVPSAATGPRVARAPDPIPPDPPTLPPIDLLWTALPDATGHARAVLRWPAVSGASGYVVWEATETAVRNAVDPAAPAPAPGTTMLARAGALRSLLTAGVQSQARSLVAFSRLRDRLIPATELELELPGAADTLYAYRVSAVTAANVESPRSPAVALVAVPHRVVPGRPRLLLRTAAGGIDVILLPGKGAVPAGFRVHRVRREGLAAEIGMMGPPVLDETATGWHAHDVPRRPGSSEADKGKSILDPVPESWYAYHYRVVAVGAPDPPNGGLAGESEPSATAVGVRPPSVPPLLDTVSTIGNGTNKVLSFRTNLPVRPSPAGRAKIAIVRLAAPAAGARLERSPVLTVESDAVEQGNPLTPLASPTAEQLAAMPKIRRGAPDTQGRCTYTVRMRAEVKQGFVVVTDPLSRSVEQSMPEVEVP